MLAARSNSGPWHLLRLGKVVVAIALAVLVASCRQAPPRRPRFVDWVTTAGLRSNMGQAEPAGEFSCADENRFVRPMRGGEEFSVTGLLGESARLVISTCASRPLEGSGGAGTLRVTVVDSSPASQRGSGENPAVRAEFPVSAFSKWQRHQVDLAGLANRQVTLRLTATLPAGRTLYLQDIYVEHWTQVVRPEVKLLPRRAARKGTPAQVLLISVDTLREDALSVLGGSHPTPGLDRFAGAAQIFLPHYSAAAWTQPSHAALLTGQPHRVHGADNGKRAIHPAVPTLAERFRAQGFATAGLVFDCFWLDPRFGFGRGFDQYRSVHWTLGQSVRQTLNWVDEHRDRSFFYFLHTFEPHSDYRRLPYEGPGVRPLHVAQRFGLESYGCREGHCSSMLLQAINSGTVAALAGEEKILRYLYDRGVDTLDSQLAALFAGLAQRGLFDNMLIVLTSDHGESFYEHAQLLHGHPWQEEIRVPLLIKWPGGERAGEKVTVPSSALDVVPTLLEELGMDTTGLPGAHLLRRRSERPIFTGANFDAVIEGRWKAVLGRLEGERWLFDLTADPGEMHNLVDELPAEFSRLEEVIAKRKADEQHWAAQLVEAGERQQQMSEEERARLRALGYLND